MSHHAQVYQIADELRGIASAGIHYATHFGYDAAVLSRYKRVLTASAQLLSVLEQRSIKDVLAQYDATRLRWNPLLVASAAVFRNGRLLVVRQPETGLWSLPREVVSPETLFAATVRRCLEEQVGVTGEPNSLLGVFDSLKWGYPAKAQFHQIVFRAAVEEEFRDSEDIRLVLVHEIDELVSELDPITRKVLELHQESTKEIPFFDLGDHRGGWIFEERMSPPKSSAGDEMLRIARRLADVACEGLGRPEHQYAKERYHHLASASARLDGIACQWTPNRLPVPYEDNLQQASPSLGAYAAAFKDDQILLIRREDNGAWAMPAGAADIGEAWANTSQRELEEETSVPGTVKRLLAIFDMRVFREPPRPLVLACFLVEPDSDARPRRMPETLDARYFPLDNLPPISPASTVHTAINLFRERIPHPYVDLGLPKV